MDHSHRFSNVHSLGPHPGEADGLALLPLRILDGQWNLTLRRASLAVLGSNSRLLRPSTTAQSISVNFEFHIVTLTQALSQLEI
jgi:hypothetical protein